VAGKDQPRGAARPVAGTPPAAGRAWHVRARSVRLAGRLAITEDKVAATMGGLARQRPGRAGHFRALSARARANAARARQWAENHRRCP
jgi:hypothetical protein